MEDDGRDRCAVILLNYKRPGNIAPIVRRCLASASRPDVFVVDNSADGSAGHIAGRHPAVTYLPQGANLGCGRRYAVSAGLPHAVTICIDDDVFLSPAQVDALFDRARRQPGRAHGVWGDGFVTEGGRIRFAGGLTQRTVAVPFLNRVYAFSRAYLAEASLTLAKLGMSDWSESGANDYLLFSLGGRELPQCHALGPFGECRTSNEPGIAEWQESGFYEGRTAFLHALLRVVPHPAATLEAMTRHMWAQPKVAPEVVLRQSPIVATP